MSTVKREILSRISFLYILAGLFSLLIIFKILYIQIVEKEKLLSLMHKTIYKKMQINALRGKIISSDDVILATSLPYFDLYFDAKAKGLTKENFYKNINIISNELAKIFPQKTRSEYYNLLIYSYKRGYRYFPLVKKMTYDNYKKLKSIPVFKENSNKTGLIFEKKYCRVKFFKNLASRTIGYVKEDVKVGLEGAYDCYLRGQNGFVTYKKLHNNAFMILDNDNNVKPIDGYDVKTTINFQIQDICLNALLEALEKHKANYGCVIIMEVKTGKVRGIVNLEYDSLLNTYLEKYNYAIGQRIEPGSIFKLFSLLVAFEDGKINLNDVIDVENGEISYYGIKMKDTKFYKNKLTVEEIFAYSSNVGISKIIYNAYNKNPKQFINRLYSIRLNRTLGIDIKGEKSPIIKDPSDSNWYKTTLPWMSIGYEIKLTPIQVLAYYNAIANNGMLLKPMFIESIYNKGKEIKKFEPTVIIPSLCSKKTLTNLQQILKSVVEYGTAKKIKNKYFSIAGKTGTALIATDKYGYNINNKKSYISSFVGYFPAENPRYSCFVMIVNPKDEYYGGIVAAPVFKNIAEKIVKIEPEFFENLNISNNTNLSTTNLFPNNSIINYDDILNISSLLNLKENSNKITTEYVKVKVKNNEIDFQELHFSKNVVPNLIGMNLKDAIYILNNIGAKFCFIGYGKVIKQKPLPNTPLKNNEIIFLELKI